MKVNKEVSLYDLETWQGATDTKDRIINKGKEDEFQSLIEGVISRWYRRNETK